MSRQEALKMEKIGSSETSLNFYRNTEVTIQKAVPLFTAAAVRTSDSTLIRHYSN
jgi:hypothetical protein